MGNYSLLQNLPKAGFKLERLTVQTFTDANPKPQPDPLAKIFFHSFASVKIIQEQGGGSYWCINPQDKPGKRGIDHTSSWITVGLDLDIAKEGDNTSPEEIGKGKQELLKLLEQLAYPPTGIIETKNGLQPYWLFDSPLILKTVSERQEANETYKRVVKGLEAALGHHSEGDSISRVLRLEGTLHQKNPQELFKITSIGGSGNLVPRQAFIDTYRLEPKTEKKFTRLDNKPGDDSIYAYDVIEGLTKLSSHELVNGETYEFEEERSGKRQIVINGQRSGQWIDVANNAIGGHPGGEGSYNLVRWVQWYQPDMPIEAIRQELDKLLLGKTDEDTSSVQIIQFEDYRIIISHSRFIKVEKDNRRYQLQPYGPKYEVALYLDDTLIHRDVLNLSSNRSRKGFASECGNHDGLDEAVIQTDLLKLTEIIDEVNRHLLQQEIKPEADKPTPEEVQAAETLLNSPTLLYDALKIIKRLGVAGEETTALVHYLVFTSRLTDDPLSVVVKGESSVGKSYVVSKVMTLFPHEAYIDITDATAQSFFYAPENHFAHKIIVIFELHGSDKADYSIRTLQSEKKLKIQVTIKDPDTGEFTVKEKEVNGPSGFITTTTNARIHAENETRHLSLFPDESITQTELTFAVSDAKYRGVTSVPEAALKPWRVMQTLLKPYPVLIPFVEELRRQFPKEPVRVRRDYNKLLAMIAVITLLHQRQREIIKEGEQEYLVASLADFQIAKILLENTFKKTIFAIPPKTETLIKTTKELGESTHHDGVSIRDLADKVGWDYDTAKKWFDPGYQKGYFKRVQEHKGSQAALYLVTDKELPSENILPFTEDLYTKDQSWLGKETLYHPITGETYTLAPEETESTDVPMA